jgi:cobalt/nickel transport system permease protein
MHHITVDGWSRRRSPLHARDARAKLGVLLVFLVALSTTPANAWWSVTAYAVLILIAAAVSRLPLKGVLFRAVLLLPFTASFALLTWWSGSRNLALMLGAKTFLSGLASLLLIGTTPLTDIAYALEQFYVPRMIVLVIQFIYRYLFVVSEQGQHMRLAAAARGGSARRQNFQAAAGGVGVLFTRSWERAEGIHSAMLARSFGGVFHPLNPPHFHPADIAFLFLASTACLLVRILL